MFEDELDASSFMYTEFLYTKIFESILIKITTCYLMLKNDKKVIPIKNENNIRNILLNEYINNPKIKKLIELDYFILPEVPETSSSGRTDLRIFSPNTFYCQDEYYIIECKRLDNKARRGNSGLNYKYIENGIQRFTACYYSSFHKTNGMIGFLVEPIDIYENVKDINHLLKNNFDDIKTLSLITKEHFIKDFDYHYSSKHTTKDGSYLKLYHLMYDFSEQNV